jgi:hypothetical protein
MQPGSFALSIMRAEVSDKALCVDVASLIPSPSTCSPYDSSSRVGEGQGESCRVFARDLDSLYDSLANPVNIAAVLILY